MVILLAVLAVVGAAAAFMAGLHAGRRLMWRQMRTIRPFGVECLERLAAHWKAKVEIVDVPGGSK